MTLKEGATATENELREFAFAHLAYYKVPGRVLIVDEIPKGPRGYYFNAQARRTRQVLNLYRQALQRYKAQPYAGRITLFQSEQMANWSNPSWTRLTQGRVDCHLIPASSHVGLLRAEADVQRLAEQLRACLDKLQI